MTAALEFLFLGTGTSVGVPVIGLDTWPNLEGVRYVSTPAQALDEMASVLTKR